MGSKKGVGITVGILVAITIASFMVWLDDPTNTEMTIVVTDFENHDVGITERHKIISSAIEESFLELVDGKYVNELVYDTKKNTSLTGNSRIPISSFGESESGELFFSDRSTGRIFTLNQTSSGEVTVEPVV